MITYPTNINKNNLTKRLFAMLCKRYDCDNLNSLSHEIHNRSQSGIILNLNAQGNLLLHSVKKYSPDYELQDDLSFPEFVARFKRYDEICLDVMNKQSDNTWNENHPVGMT